MHRHRNRNKHSFFGRIPLILLILGAVVYFGFYLGYVPKITWTFSPIVIIIIIIVALGGVSSRRRMSKRNQEETNARAQSPYRQYEPPVVREEKKDFTSTPDYKYRNHYEMQFCNYCGIKLETEKQSFCVNCGQRIN